MYHYVYKLEDPITGEYYYGSRSSSIKPEEDPYKGSMKTWIPDDKERLIKTIVKENFSTRDEAIEYEDMIIANTWKTELSRNYSRPSAKFHTTGFDCKAEKNGFYGKMHTEEIKRKQGRSGSANASYGKKWIHKEGIRKYVKEEFVKEFINDGWTLGYLYTNNKNPLLVKRIWITNGLNNRYVKSDELFIPEGWYIGKTYSQEAKDKAKKNLLLMDRKKNANIVKEKLSGLVWLHNENGNYRAKPEEVDDLLNSGYKKGRKDYVPWNKKKNIDSQ